MNLDFENMHLAIHDHATKHGLTDEQIEHAWRNAVDYIIVEGPDSIVDLKVIGFDTQGRGIEITAAIKGNECALIYHANSPISHRALVEFGLA